MSLVIAPVSYKRLLTTISQHSETNVDQFGKQVAMKDMLLPINTDTFLVDNSYVSKKTNFLDILDEETLLQLVYEFELDKKADLPELKDIEVLMDNYSQNNHESLERETEKMIQR